RRAGAARAGQRRPRGAAVAVRGDPRCTGGARRAARVRPVRGRRARLPRGRDDHLVAGDRAALSREGVRVRAEALVAHAVAGAHGALRLAGVLALSQRLTLVELPLALGESNLDLGAP